MLISPCCASIYWFREKSLVFSPILIGNIRSLRFLQNHLHRLLIWITRFVARISKTEISIMNTEPRFQRIISYTQIIRFIFLSLFLGKSLIIFLSRQSIFMISMLVAKINWNLVVWLKIDSTLLCVWTIFKIFCPVRLPSSLVDDIATPILVAFVCTVFEIMLNESLFSFKTRLKYSPAWVFAVQLRLFKINLPHSKSRILTSLRIWLNLVKN